MLDRIAKGDRISLAGAAALIALVAMGKIDASLHRFVETIGVAAASPSCSAS